LQSISTARDYMVTTYRGVHDLIAKGVPLRGFFAEALGRKDGINKGKAARLISVIPRLERCSQRLLLARVRPLPTGLP